MNIKKGDTIKVLDNKKIEQGHDLTNDKEYEVMVVSESIDSFVVIDDAGDILIITEDGAKVAVEKVGKVETAEKTELDDTILKMLSEFVEELKAVVRAELAAEGRKHDEEERKNGKIKIDLANLARKSVIEDAKKFLEEHTKPNCYVKGNPAITYRVMFGVNPEFHVNEKKRTVTLLLRGAGDGKIMCKEIVRCAPTDVFNAHIGKAIALGRALNLDVKKFTHAAQPREVVVGQVFKVSSRGVIYGKTGTITKMKPNLDGIFGTAFSHTIDDGWLGSEQITITDDTEAKYE